MLWLAPNGGNYKNHTVKGTGGWIGSLQDELVKRVPDLELGIIFGSTDSVPVKEGNVSYFPIKIREANRVKEYLINGLNREVKREKMFIAHTNQVIEVFKPDVVHIWGIENTYAAVIPYLKCPFVVHIQGLLSLSLYIYMPPAVSLKDIIQIDSLLNPKTWIKKVLRRSSKDICSYDFYRAERELRVSSYISHWMGRTDWDYKASQMLSPGSRYYHCDELMRGDFSDAEWQYHYDGKTIIIHSSISSEWYKGIDVILNTSVLLKKQGVSIKWNVYGVDCNDPKVRFFSKKMHIKPADYNVLFHGRVNGEVIKDALLDSDVFVHPSYIENSSNAIAEAMMLGVPTIAHYVGGNSSMLKENSGVLVAPNEPFMLAYEIMKMRDKKHAEDLSTRERVIAKERQNSTNTINDLIEIYSRIVNSKSDFNDK